MDKIVEFLDLNQVNFQNWQNLQIPIIVHKRRFQLLTEKFKIVKISRSKYIFCSTVSGHESLSTAFVWNKTILITGSVEG